MQPVRGRLVEQRPPLRLGLARARAVAGVAHLDAVVRDAAAGPVLARPRDEDRARAPVAAGESPARQVGIRARSPTRASAPCCRSSVQGAAPGGSTHSTIGCSSASRRALRLQAVDALLVEGQRRAPSVPVVAPRTLALAAGCAVCVSVTWTFMGWPTVATVGPGESQHARSSRTGSRPTAPRALREPLLAAAGARELPLTRVPRTASGGWARRPPGSPWKSSKLLNQCASHAEAGGLAASSSAAVAVGRATAGRRRWCRRTCGSRPTAVVTSWPSVVTGSSKMVLAGALHPEVHGDGRGKRGGSRGQAEQERALRERCPAEAIGHRATPSSRVVWASAGVRSPGFELRAAPSR